MSTNDAFIKAFRRDAARPATPPPARATTPSHMPSLAAADAWHTTIEIAAAHFAPAVTTVATTLPAIPPPEASPLQRAATPSPTPSPAGSRPVPAHSIGKRPLSSFQPPMQRPAIAPAAPNILTPETIISAFRWPSVCRTLWNDHAADYERVAETLLATSRAGRPIIGITSINTGDGCTATLLCLAVALAARKTRLALVDANFHHPNLADALGAEPATSWADVLDRGLPVAEAMIRATHDRVDLLPLDTGRCLASHEATELVAGMQTTVTAGVLRTAYDLVLVDLGALLAPGAYTALSHLLRLMPIEAAIVVTNPRTADAHDTAVVGDLLEEDGCELLGVIENRTNSARKEAKEQSSQRKP
jgi:Mrp family chromosome partitioning ATPase